MQHPSLVGNSYNIHIIVNRILVIEFELVTYAINESH